MRKSILILIGALCLNSFAFAQVTIGSGIEPNQGVLLDLKETNELGVNSTKGLKMPRVLLNTANDLAPTIVGATAQQKQEVIGLTVYHIGSLNLCAGLYIWDSNSWLRIPGACQIAIQCASVQVNGTYTVGAALSVAKNNTISLSINVPLASAGGIYHIYTDTQNGMSFSGTGPLAAGTMNIVLTGSGTPSAGGSATTFNLKADYSNSISSNTCTATIPSNVIVLSKTTILGFGYYGGASTFGYFLHNSASSAMMKSSSNFGTLATSTVKAESLTINIIPAVDGLTSANFLAATNGLNSKPDIIIHGYYSYISETSPSPVTDALVKYIKEDKGVAILFDEYYTDVNNSIAVRILRGLFPAATISSVEGPPSGTASLILATVAANDDILDGPFSVNNWTDKLKIDLRGKRWGNDATAAREILGIPASEVIVYSTGTNGGATMFRLKNYNLFFVGDGGFLSNNSGYAAGNPNYPNFYSGNASPEVNICPFAVDANSRPIARINFGAGTAGTEAATVYNSQLFGNIMTWALKNAASNKK